MAEEDLQKHDNDGYVPEDLQLKNDVVDAPGVSQLKNDAVDAPEDSLLKNDAVDAPEDSQLKNDSVDAPEDSQLKNDAVDAPSDLQLKVDVTDALEDSVLENDAVCAPEDSQLKRNDVVCVSEEMQLKVDGANVPEDLEPSVIKESDYHLGCEKEEKWPGWPGENVFRMLVPVDKVGGLIGRKGESIKKIMEETRARIRVLDGPPGSLDRAVIVSAKEEPDTALSPAMDGLLRVHKRIIGADDDATHAASDARGTVVTRILAADTQGRSLIGKQGSTIKSIQDASGCTIRVIQSEHLPLIAMQDDSVVEIRGEPAGVHKAVELIANHLRKFLVDRNVIGLFETRMPNIQPHQSMPSQQSWGPRQGFPDNTGVGPGYGSSPQYFVPQHQYDDYYPPSGVPLLDKQSHQRPSMRGRDASIDHLSNAKLQQSVAGKVTTNMQIPLSHADVVVGISGASISYIRRASGAAIAIQETRGVPDEMTVEISGSASQIQTAQQLIQNFIAEASSNTQNKTGGPVSRGFNAYPAQSTRGSVNQEYNPFQAADPTNAYQLSEATGHASRGPSGGYDSLYGTDYGY